MAYLIIDPCGRYPAHFMEFLARCGQRAVAVFSSDARLALWHGKWSRELGRFVVGEFLVTPGRLAVVAAQISRDFPDLAGVIPWDEESILLGAALGDELALGWNPLSVIERCRDKSVMKAWLRRQGRARVNASTVVADGEQALAFQRQLGRWPVVVKPTDGAGSEDVYFPSERGELLAACQTVLESGAGAVLLEEFVDGPEFAVNGVVDANRDLLVTDVWTYDRRDVGDLTNLYFQVIKVAARDPVFGQLAQYAATVVEDLELRRAPIHMEVKIDQLGPCLIEVGARFGGGDLPILSSKLHGRSLFELAACHYLTDLDLHPEDVDLARYDGWEARVVEGVQEEAIPSIRDVCGVAEVETLPSFDGFGMLRPRGTPAPRTCDLDTRAWEVHLIHRDAQQIELDAERVRELLRYEG